MRREKRKRNEAGLKLLPDKMTIKFNVIGAFVKNGVFSDVNRSLTVRKKGDRQRGRNRHVIQKTDKPGELSHNMTHRVIFGFGRGKRDGRLFLGFHRNRATTQTNEETTDVAPGFRASTPIGITKGKKVKRGSGIEKDP